MKFEISLQCISLVCYNKNRPMRDLTIEALKVKFDPQNVFFSTIFPKLKETGKIARSSCYQGH